MWAKNGQTVLPLTLRRIDEVLPQEIIGEKIFVDDHSIDESAEIAEDFGWSVYRSEGYGISNAANTALRKVKTDFFISVEQDILLASNWWEVMENNLPSPKIPVVSGVRVPSHPVLSAIERYYIQRDIPYTSMDNTIYLTEVVKSIGGFPMSRYAVDSLLRRKLESAGYIWKVVKNVISMHLRKGGLKEELLHQYRYGREGTMRGLPKNFAMVIFSPVRGLQIALKYKKYEAFLYYPIMRLTNFIGNLTAFS
ncbi:MAG: glycosyltransferase family 2 protein [Candidatus Methanomethyliaceae archaeon]